VKHKKLIFTIIVIVISLIVGYVIYHFYGSLIYDAIYPTSSEQIIDREFENQDHFPLESLRATYLEHLNIIWPTLAVALVIGLLFVVLGSFIVVKITLILIILALASIMALTLYSNPGQFFIIILPLFSSYIFASFFFRKVGVIDKLNAFFILLCCQIIFVMQVLSLFDGIDGRNFLVFVSIIFIFSLCSLKKIRGVVGFDINHITLKIKQVGALIEQNNLISIFLGVVLISFLWRIILIVYIPPNNADSMTYHLSRVAYWLQYGSLDLFYTHNVRQTTFPFNAEILFMWTMIASKLDYLCGFIQFICYLLSGTVLYKCVREYLNVDKIPSINIALIWYSLPLVILESTTTQNDLVLAYFIITSFVYFLLSGKNNNSYLILSGLSLALAVGTKATFIFYLIPFVVAIPFLKAKENIAWQKIYWWGIIFFLAWLTLGSYAYIQNFIEYGHVLSSKEFVSLIDIETPSIVKRVSVLSQYIFNIVSNQTGLFFYVSILVDHYIDFVAKIGSDLFDALHIPINIEGTFRRDGFVFNAWIPKFRIHEDYSYFGSIGFVLFITTLFVFFMSFLKLINRKVKFDYRYLIFAYFFLGYLVTLSCFYRYDPWGSRFMITMFIVSLPMLALIVNSKNTLTKQISSIIVVYIIIMLIPITFMNQNKPFTPYKMDRWGIKLKGRPEVKGMGWSRLSRNKDRLGLRCLLRPHYENYMRKYEFFVPDDSKVGIVLSLWQRDYLLFGEGLTRTVIPVNEEHIQSQEFDYLVIDKRKLEQFPNLKRRIKNDYSFRITLGTDIYSKIFLYVHEKNKNRIIQLLKEGRI